MYQERNFYCKHAVFRVGNIVRYWIWWNDISQGPFELDELTSLRAFSEDLLVCMEDREDWVPAGRVADLSSAIEKLRERRAAPLAPPPPPPKRPPTVTPLQGEFFSEPPEQQSLLKSDDEPKGPYAYRAVPGEFDLPVSYFSGQATMPFHFVHQPQRDGAVIEIPMPRTPHISFAPAPVIKESPVRQPEEEPAHVPLALLREDAVSEAPAPIELPDLSPSAAPSFEESVPERRRVAWLPWVAGVLVAVGILGSAGYWVLDRYSTHSAIVEANRLEPQKPMSLPSVVPVFPLKAKVRGFKSVPRKVMKSTVAKVKKIRAPFVAPTSTPAPKPVPEAAPSVPGMAASAPEKAAVVPVVPPVDPPVQSAQAPADPWKGRETEAITVVQSKTLPKSKITIGSQARSLLQGMHEKELLHAAETGERLYLPDKMGWTALHEEGSRYRVYLNFLSWQANGERVQSRSYQFLVDLRGKEVKADDAATLQEILTQPTELTFKHNPMATDIDSILGGVDTYNKHKVQLIIVKKSARNREERKKIEAAQAAAGNKVRRAVLYFRKTYKENALQNVGKAYQFTDLLKG